MVSYTGPVHCGSNVKNENIDFSIGLAASLKLLEVYRQNGILYAEIEHVTGIRGRCQARIHLANGKVSACYLEDSTGKQYQAHVTTLSNLDAERGPFAWSLLAPPVTSTPAISPQKAPSLPPVSPIPRRIAPLDIRRIQAWPTKERMLLHTVFTFIDGHHSVEEVKKRVSLSPKTVDDVLQTLLSLGVITMDE